MKKRSQSSALAALTVGLAIALALGHGSHAASVDDFPSKPIRMIVPFTSGGGTDMVTRIVGQRLSTVWGKSVIVENHPGVGGIAASNIVAQAEPDGYTLGVITPTQVINPSLYKKLPFDSLKDFAPVVLFNRLQLVLVAAPSFPPNTIAELIVYAKAHPTAVNFGSTGTGGSAHLAVELIKKMADIHMTHIPYKGSAPAYADVISGRVQLLSNNIISTMPLIKNKQLKAIAVMGANRSPIAPDVPTVAQSGLPAYDVSSWFGLVAPGRTPQPIVDKLNTAIVAILQEPATRQLMLAQGAEPVDGSNTPADFGRLLQKEMKMWREVIESAGIKAEAEAR
jgi:tripartite-type tricarboxylate transporter receptor subunit TctC